MNLKIRQQELSNLKHSDQQAENFKNKQSHNDFWGNIKQHNLLLKFYTNRKRRNIESKNIFKIMSNFFSIVLKNTNLQIYESQ